MRGQCHLFSALSMKKVLIQVTTPVTFFFRVRAYSDTNISLGSYATEATFQLPQGFTVFTKTPVSVKLGSGGLYFTIKIKNGWRVVNTFRFFGEYECPEGTERITVSVTKRIPG